MARCLICNEEFANNTVLSRHIFVHKISSEDYYNNYIKPGNKPGVCKICGKPTQFLGWKDKCYRTYCSQACRDADTDANASKYSMHRLIVKAIEERDPDAINDLINSWEPRINEVADRYIKKYNIGEMYREDLLQEGRLAVYNCIIEYSADEFASKVGWQIVHAITRSIEDTSKAIRIPSHNWEELDKDNVEAKDLFDKLDVKSLDEEFTKRDYVDDEYADHMDSMIQANTHEVLKSIIDKRCTDQQKEILKMRYSDDMTMAEIGKKYNISRERVRQILNNTQEKIEESLYIRDKALYEELQQTRVKTNSYNTTN